MQLPRLYPILDTATLAARGGLDLRRAARVLLAAGAEILQVRHKGHFNRDLFETTRLILSDCAAAGATLVINDRLDVAMLLAGTALHLGQTDLPPAEARRLAPGLRIGFSTHNEAQLNDTATHGAADYLALGPVFGTTSKANPDPEVGLANLRSWRGRTAKPLVAIGGITPANARAVLAAGADSVALISALYPDPLTEDSLRKRTEEWLHLLRN